jgi:hypothetical protein
MQLNRTFVFFIGAVLVAWMSLPGSNPASAQSVPRVPEEVAVFSVCSQAPDAARDVQSKVNVWFDSHRSVRVVQREMFTAACPGATEFGSIAITVAIHYQL